MLGVILESSWWRVQVVNIHLLGKAPILETVGSDREHWCSWWTIHQSDAKVQVIELCQLCPVFLELFDGCAWFERIQMTDSSV